MLKKMQIFKRILVFVLITAALLFVIYYIYGRYTYSKILGKISAVELGMAKDDVIKIMGTPIKVTESDSLEYFYFDAPSICAELPACVFNKRTGTVIITTWDTTIKK